MTDEKSRFLVSALCALALLVLGAGCELLPVNSSSPNAQAFEVHLQNNFDEDRVRVEIDGEVVFNDRVSTDYLWSLAEVVVLKAPEGKRRLRVVVNGSEEGKAQFNLDKKLYIGVRYYKEPIPSLEIPEGIVMDVSEEEFIYD